MSVPLTVRIAPSDVIYTSENNRRIGIYDLMVQTIAVINETDETLTLLELVINAEKKGDVILTDRLIARNYVQVWDAFYPYWSTPKTQTADDTLVLFSQALPKGIVLSPTGIDKLTCRHGLALQLRGLNGPYVVPSGHSECVLATNYAGYFHIPIAEFINLSIPEYVLPYTVGETYRLNQGNCSGFGHSGFWEFGYDIVMPIGTVITASREGEVVHAQDGAIDGDRARTNLITVEHADGSVALYSHLTLNGVQVTVGQFVLAGDTIGLSGDTGNTGGLPHLHFSLHPCRSLPGLPGTDNCPSMPLNFSNTDANPDGLIANQRYEALPFN